jgi:flagellar assembly protein FliH
VDSAGMVVDATLQKRWQRAVATLGLESSWEDASEPS